jgi:single-stranded-DNA-specific exonuclease
VQRDRLDDLRERLIELIFERGFSLEDGEPEIRLEARVAPDRVNLPTAQALRQLEPHGGGNERPLLLLEDLRVLDASIVGQDRRHLSMTLQAAQGQVRAIFFGGADRLPECRPGTLLEIAGHMAVDRWNGVERLNLEVRDLRLAGTR